MKRRLVIALGGNAIIQPGQKGTAAEQVANVTLACRDITDLVADGAEVVITHGNGPQVGNALLRSEEGSAVAPPLPLDVCGAETQGELGYYIQQALANQLSRRSVARAVATIVTQTEVDGHDPAFANPTKPVGPFYTAERAAQLRQERGWCLVEDSGRGWRRVVPSPGPRRLVEAAVIRVLVEAGAIVVASGGGGIPVVRNADGQLRGVEAVIDKDLAAAVLARDVGADQMVILTDVEGVFVDFRGPGRRLLRTVDLEEAGRLDLQGQFGVGSMGPKVRAGLAFTGATGKPTLITALSSLPAGLAGEAGTRIVAGPGTGSGDHGARRGLPARAG